MSSLVAFASGQSTVKFATRLCFVDASLSLLATVVYMYSYYTWITGIEMTDEMNNLRNIAAHPQLASLELAQLWQRSFYVFALFGMWGLAAMAYNPAMAEKTLTTL